MLNQRCLVLMLTAVYCWVVASASAAETSNPAKPNVIIILTDDQGYGDLGCHGNPVIQTPRLDAFARESAELANFYVCPVCSPTRASVLTGRYNYRTGIVDTYIGRSMMYTDEVTLAEMLAGAGYRTGIFGKWHLGDAYPMRPMDQGFQEALVHRGGGIGQPSDPPEATSYFDPILQHNGHSERYAGYCSDIFTDGLLNFIEGSEEVPFLAVLTFNAPHGPLEVPDEYLRRYEGVDIAGADYRDVGRPPSSIQVESARRVYAMVSNIDDNVGRILDKLEELDRASNTIVIFFTDNGPQQPRYVAGLRGLKGSVYEGGIRVPCYVRWPAKVKPERKVTSVAAHIDLLPTLLDCCGLSVTAGLKIDGVSLKPLLTGEADTLPERPVFFQWHRGNVPELGRACAIRQGRWKLVQPIDPDRAPASGVRWELYDLESDPFEQRDVGDDHPDKVRELRNDYEAWFADMEATRHFARPRIEIGTPHEKTTVLTRQDWRTPGEGWDGNGSGRWELLLDEQATFGAKVVFSKPIASPVTIQAGSETWTIPVQEASPSLEIPRLTLTAGDVDLSAWTRRDDEILSAWQVELTRVD